MKPSRILSCVLVLVLAFAAVSSYAEELYFNAEGYPICNEPVELSVAFVNTSENHDWTNRTMYEKFRDDFGIVLNCQDFLDGTALKSQMTMWLSDNTLPDMIGNAGFAMTDIAEWGSEGYLLDFSQYLDIMPNISALFEEAPEYRAYLTAPDGGIYGFSKLELNVFGRVERVFMNNTWLENVGMPLPTSIDELYDVLVAFRDEDANGNGDPEDEIPFGFGENGKKDQIMLLAAFGILTGSPNYALQLDEDGNVILGNTTENYKAYLEFLHKLYDEGLIDKECFVITDNERKEKVKTDKYGFFAASAPFAWSGKDISYDAGFSWVSGLTSDYNAERVTPLTSSVGAKIMFTASAATKYPEAICRLIDWAFSEEGEIITQRGWEGINFDYEYVDCLEGSVANLYCPEGYNSTEQYKTDKVMMWNVFGPYASRGLGTQYRLIKVASDDVVFGDEAVAKYGWAVLVERGRRQEGMVEKNVFPALSYTDKEAKERAALYTDISNYISNCASSFIIGDMDLDADWDKYLAELDNMKLDKLLEIENAAYERFAEVQ